MTKQPVNLSPMLSIFFQVMPKFNEVMADKTLTVGEAIDLMHHVAKVTVQEMGMADNVIATTQPKEE